MDQLRRRLEETERAMERIVAQMGNVSEKLMPILSTDASANADKVTSPAIPFHYKLMYTSGKVMRSGADDNHFKLNDWTQESDEVVADPPESPTSDKGAEEVDNGAHPASSGGDSVAEVEEIQTSEVSKNTQAPESNLEDMEQTLDGSSAALVEEMPEEASSVHSQQLEDSFVEENAIEEAPKQGTLAEEQTPAMEETPAEEVERLPEEGVTSQTCQDESGSKMAEAIAEERADDHDQSTEDCPIDELCLELREAVKSIGDLPDKEVDEAPVCGRQSSEERRLTVVGVDVVAAMEDGQKMAAELLPRLERTPKSENVDVIAQEPIPSVFLDASIPAESHLVVSEAECRAEAVPVEQLDLDATEYESSPVVLSGKMTLSVIGIDNPPEEESAVSDSKIAEEESDSGHRVRFAPKLTDHIFLIPVSEQEEAALEEPHLPAEEEEEEATERRGSLIDYRPPTPPLPHSSDSPVTEENEFLTYDQLEEAGEIDMEESIQPELEEETIRAEVKEQCLQPEILLDIEYQLIPSSSTTSLDTTTSQTSLDEFRPEVTTASPADEEKDRNIDVVQHALEQVPAAESRQLDAESVPEATEEEPTISSFTIREDFAEDDVESTITEEEILQARKEIEEIKQLLAGVSNDVLNQQNLVSVSPPPDASPVSDDIVVQLANVRPTNTLVDNLNSLTKHLTEIRPE